MGNAQSQPPILPISQPKPSSSTSQTGQTPSEKKLSFRSHPVKLLASDIKLVFKNLLLVRFILSPFSHTTEYSEIYLSRNNVLNSVLQALLVILGAWLIVAILVWLAAPGLVFALFMMFYCALTALLCVPFNHGLRKVIRNSSKAGDGKVPDGEVPHTSDEKAGGGEEWVFVNGICTGKHWLEANLDQISETFGRPVTGIHNQTYGAVFDLIQCLIQRSLSYFTGDTRVLYDHLKEKLSDREIKKCVVIAHSQGGIILSIVLDCLFADLPDEDIEKLEIYTFGCAANHFNNPVRSGCSSSSPHLQTPSPDPPVQERVKERVIKHIEHYGNEKDFVAKLGPLCDRKDRLSNSFAGKIFKCPGGGHLLNQHYLGRLFAHDGDGDVDVHLEMVEDEAVQRDQDSSKERTQEEPRSLRSPPPTRTEIEEVPVGISNNPGWGSATKASVSTSAKPQRNGQLKDLSRLWRYRNGESPD